MKKKILALCCSLVIAIGLTPLLASAEYVDQGDSWGYYYCLDGIYRNIHVKWSITSKPSHLGTSLQGDGELARNSDTNPTYKDYFAQTYNGLSAGGIAPRRVSVVVGISAIGVNQTQSEYDTTTATILGYRSGSGLGTNWTMFVTSESLYTTVTTEYYRVNNW